MKALINIIGALQFEVDATTWMLVYCTQKSLSYSSTPQEHLLHPVWNTWIICSQVQKN